MTTAADNLPSLPDRSTGWKKGTVTLFYKGDTKPEVPGLVKGNYGVSRGPGEKSSHRLTHLPSGCLVFAGPQGVCKRLADALHEHLPKLEALDNSDTTRLAKREVVTFYQLLSLARDA